MASSENAKPSSLKEETEKSENARPVSPNSFMVEFGNTKKKPESLQNAFLKYKKKRQVSGL